MTIFGEGFGILITAHWEECFHVEHLQEPLFDYMNLDIDARKKPEATVEDVQRNIRMFAKFGDGHWYAILPGMEGALRKLGAVVQSMNEEPERLDINP